MSGTASTWVTMGLGGGFGGEVGYGGYKPLFTAMQLQELEHQAMVYKYLVAGLPIPLDLVEPIQRSFEMISARLLHHPSLSYCSYYGKKFDPEPGRCRRTDGKKWRCSKNAHPDSKYCERHMHRGLNRSRKPVESQSNSQSMSTVLSHISTGCSSNSGSFQASVSESFQNVPLYSFVNSEGPSFGSNLTKLQMDPLPYGINNKEFRYMHGTNPDADEHSVSAEASGSVESLGLGSSSDSSTRHFIPSQVASSSFIKHKPDSQFLGHCSTQQSMHHAFKFIDSTTPKEHQQHCFFGSEVSSSAPIKQEQHPVHPFFSEWPTTKEPWSNLDEDESNKNIVSSTQLSISIPRASTGYSSRGANSPSGNSQKIFS